MAVVPALIRSRAFNTAAAGNFVPYFPAFCAPPWLSSHMHFGQAPTTTSVPSGAQWLQSCTRFGWGRRRGRTPRSTGSILSQWGIPGPENLLDHVQIWPQFRSNQAIKWDLPPETNLLLVFSKQEEYLLPYIRDAIKGNFLGLKVLTSSLVSDYFFWICTWVSPWPPFLGKWSSGYSWVRVSLWKWVHAHFGSSFFCIVK